MGKSRRSATGSTAARGVEVSIAIGARLAGSLDRGPIRVALGVEVGALRDQECLIRCVRLESGLAKDRAVALLLELERKVAPSGLDDPALGEDVHDVGLDVVQQALVMGDEEHAEVRVE